MFVWVVSQKLLYLECKVSLYFKALVNQVAAVVYARFHRKKMPDGRAVFGTFTRDYRYNALTCQVLITVPQCLEILMMSPKRQDWVAKMRYVIFDEVSTTSMETTVILDNKIR